MMRTPEGETALAAIAAGAVVPCMRRERDGWHARWRLASGGENRFIDRYMRAAAASALCADAENQRHASLHDAWLAALRSKTGLVRGDEAECARFARVLDGWGGECAEDADARASFRFSAAPDGRDVAISCGRPRTAGAYRALGQAVAIFHPLSRLAPDAGKETLSAVFGGDDLRAFMAGGKTALENAGYAVDGCDLAADITAECSIESAETPDAGPQNQASCERRHEATVVVRVAGEKTNAREIRFLLAQKSNVVFFRNRWIEVDRGVLKQALKALETLSKRKLTRNEALAFALGTGRFGALGATLSQAGAHLRSIVANLLSAKGAAAAESASSCAKPAADGSYLRPYQRAGVAWMRFLAHNGFGALLADDMGLGKTVQTIAFLQEEKRAGRSCAPALVVAPLGLLANWRREFERFAPELGIYVHHGAERAAGKRFVQLANAADAVVTNYAVLVKDRALFAKIAWGASVLDEAQTVKNPETAAAAAVRSIGAATRIALTGTPVENSAVDLWSIEDYLNPGLLGAYKDFVEDYAKPIAANPRCKAASKLSAAIEPFVLRRLKSDPQIVAEIGAKRVSREYCRLSPEQRDAYAAELAVYSHGERRRGDMFALLTRLKQICDGAGKIELLCSIVSSVFDAGESALVFTQFVETGRRLKAILSERFGRPVMFLDGSMTPSRREREIAAFSRCDGPAAFVLSLKAGGFGLNLVKATHVIHFDRWWNPAVESQATDRAHRIGQTRDVMSHLLISEGTLEERIDALLERKSAAAGGILRSGDGIFKNLAPEEFESLVRLDEDAGR